MASTKYSRMLEPNSGWQADQYQLLDFGSARKLERFGDLILDRPSPAAENERKTPGVDWSAADLVLDGGPREPSNVSTRHWQAAFGSVRFNLKVTPFGHVGVFPEQAPNWTWLAEQIVALESPEQRPLAALNLFAYTGGTTLAMAAAGAHVVHVDASEPAVTWSRQNAAASGLSEQPIRWIVEDARKFVARELRRGNRYDIIVMDPPSYGHGPTGKRWVIDEHLPGLLTDALALLRCDGRSRLLFTAHSEQPSMRDIADFILQRAPQAAITQDRLTLVDGQSRHLDAGFFVRVCL